MKNVRLQTLGTFGAPEGSDKWETFAVPPLSRIVNSGSGNFRAQPYHTAISVFNLLPAAAAAAGSDDLLLSLGTGTEVVARAAKGGVNIKTQASTPAASDNVMLKPVSNSAMNVLLNAVSQPQFRARIAITTISDPTSDATLVTSAIMAFAGLNETTTAVDPTTAAGDGAGFLYAPNPGVGGAPVALTTATGLAAATGLNFIAHQKVAGVDTFIDTGVAVVAGQDYELHVNYGPDLIPLYYINGKLVATGVAGTTAKTLGVVIGCQIMNSTPAAQVDMDVRYAAVERFLG